MYLNWIEIPIEIGLFTLFLFVLWLVIRLVISLIDDATLGNIK